MRLKPSEVFDLPAHIKRLNPHLGMGSATPPEQPKQSQQPKRIRQSSRPELNKLETEFFLRLKLSNPDASILSQKLRFRLGNGIWYKPDFVVFAALPVDKPKCYEVKGPFAHRGGFENLKVAAGLFPEFDWFLVWRDGFQWEEQDVLP